MTLPMPSKSFLKRMLVVWAALTLLFALNETGGSAALGGVQRLLFWGLQIGFGLATATLMAEVLSVSFVHIKPWRFILSSGMAGVVLFAPIAYGIDLLFGLSAIEEPDSLLDRLALKGQVAAIFAEGLQVLPEYLTCWFLVNLEAFYPLKRQDSSMASTDKRPSELPPEITPRQEADGLLQRLPPAIGQDLVAASSDLHYLHIVTARGTAMVLGTLAELEQGFGAEGVRVHRSHWVAKAHVKRVVCQGHQWRIETDTDHAFPVSRRKRELVEQTFGRNFTINPSESGAHNP